MQSLPSVHDEFTAEEARTVDSVIHGFLAHVQRHGMTRAVAGLYFDSSSGYASCELQDQVNAQGHILATCSAASSRRLLTGVQVAS